MNEKQFFNFKKQVLGCPDASKKGDIDEKIKNVIDIINSHDNFVSLSSCSGRTVVILQANSVEVMKEGSQWVYSSHGTVDPTELLDCVSQAEGRGDLVMKFEPFILHVACRSIEDAKSMLSCALEAGCKNSGLVVGKHERYTVAARNTLQMEVPLTLDGNLLVGKEYLEFLSSVANTKMQANLQKLIKFEQCVNKLVDRSKGTAV